jgi:hypothetical protein
LNIIGEQPQVSVVGSDVIGGGEQSDDVIIGSEQSDDVIIDRKKTSRNIHNSNSGVTMCLVHCDRYTGARSTNKLTVSSLRCGKMYRYLKI